MGGNNDQVRGRLRGSEETNEEERRMGIDWQEAIDRPMGYSMRLTKESEMDDKDTVADLHIFPLVISIRFGALPEKGHRLQFDTLSNSVTHVHRDAESFIIHPIPNRLPSFLAGDKNANPRRFKMD